MDYLEYMGGNEDNEINKDNKSKRVQDAAMDYLEYMGGKINSNISMEDRYPLDCNISSNKKQYLCNYHSEDTDKFKRRYPIDCKNVKYKLDRRCRNFAKKKKHSLNPKNKIIIRTQEEQKKHNEFKKKWNETQTIAFKRREDKEIEKKTIEILEKTLEERIKILSKLNITERDKIKKKIEELLAIKETENIENISKNLLKEDEEIRNKKLLQIDKEKREKIKIKMKEIIENKEKRKKQPSFLETNSFELLNTLNVIEDSVDSSLVELNTVNSKIINNFKTTMKDRIRQDKIIEKKRKQIIPYGWDISKFDNGYFYVFNLDFNNFKKKLDSVELDDVHLNENNLVEKLEIDDTKHKIIHDEEIVKYKTNVLITDNSNLEEIKFGKLLFVGKNLVIDNNKQLKTIQLNKLKSLENIDISNNSNLTEINLSSLKSVQKFFIKGNNILKLDIRNLQEVNFMGDYFGGIYININAKVIINKKLFDYYKSYYNKIKINPSLDKNKFNIITNWTNNAEIIYQKKPIESEEDYIKGGIFSNFSFQYFLDYHQKTINNLDRNTINKVILIESVYYSFFNEKNYDLTKIFLEQKNLQYFDIDSELSISESLVLINNNTNDIIIAYRGSIIKNNQDLLVDITFSIEEKNKKTYFQKFEDQIHKIKEKYNKLPIELIGHSKGHYNAYIIGDKFSINTTGFNGSFGKNIIDYDKSNKTPIHTFYRITDDIASYNISLRTLINYTINTLNIGSYDNKINNITKKQWNIYNLHPLESAVTYLETHYINNFIDDSPRKTTSSIQELKTKIKSKNDLDKLENDLKNSLLYNSPISSNTSIDDNNKILFDFSKYKLLFRNKKIYLYGKNDRKVYTENEFTVLAKKKSIENNFNKMKQLKIIELKQQNWTIITTDRDFYKHQSKEQLFDSKIYRLYKQDNGIYSLYNKYTHNIITIEQAISESKTWTQKLGEALDYFFYIKEDGVIPYRLSTFFFLSVIIPLVLYLLDNIITIVLNFISSNFYNFILSATENDLLSDNIKELIFKTVNLKLMIIHFDDWIYFPIFYFVLFNIFIVCKIFIGGKSFTTALIIYIIIALIFGSGRALLIYTMGPAKYYFINK